MTDNRQSRRNIARQRSSAAIARRVSVSSWPIVILGLLAVIIQSFVVQTHIHIPQATGASQSVSVVTLAKVFVAGSSASASENHASAPRDKYPINEDPTNCPLCQEIAHSGQFVQSAAVLAYVPVWISIYFIPFREALPSRAAAGHSWQGRAPPRA